MNSGKFYKDQLYILEEFSRDRDRVSKIIVLIFFIHRIIVFWFWQFCMTISKFWITEMLKIFFEYYLSLWITTYEKNMLLISFRKWENELLLYLKSSIICFLAILNSNVIFTEGNKYASKSIRRKQYLYTCTLSCNSPKNLFGSPLG